MKKTLNFTNKEQGFTFIEVLVGMLMATVFVLITTQGIVIGTVFRVKAQRQSEALNFIQQDLEEVKFQAAQLTAGTCGSYATELNSALSAPDSPQKLVNKPHKIIRTPTANGNVLALSYSVVPINDEVADLTGDEVVNITTEVIPDVAFDCE